MTRTFAVLTLVAAVTTARADDAFKAPTPTKAHEWLGQLVGEWETEAEMTMAPGQPAVKCKGTETVKSLGGLWVVSELKGEFMGTAMTGQMTVGVKPGGDQYVGTWVCSMCPYLWKYEGTVSGNTLTLNTEGPNPADPTKTAKMKDVMEIKDKDTRVMTSSILMEDGKWVPFMTQTAKRKK